MSGHPQRRSGIMLPLFSFPGSGSWGIGDIGDIEALTTWLSAGGQRLLQLLPLNEMASGQQSPYSSMSAMAIDPIYISVPRVPEFISLGGEAALSADDRERIAAAQRARTVDYSTVRELKARALGFAFERFLEDWRRQTPRAASLAAFIAEQAWWIDDYALYRALHEQQERRPWTEWPRELQWRDARALDEARRVLAREILFHQYLQWIADTQWQLARVTARTRSVGLFGDLPFMVDGDSADVWAHQDQFRLDRSVGVPPDAFSATGQDWGMPAYRWSTLAANDFAWLRQRAHRSAALYDGYRVDHLVGFYRTFSRPRSGGDPSFEPVEEDEQRTLGERTMALFRESGAEIIAEDLGVVPDFVRESLARLRAPGFRIFRWEREWDRAGHPFRDPQDYPAVSVAASGTHDTETMREWWEQTAEEERQAVSAIPNAAAFAPPADFTAAAFSTALRDGLLEMLYASRSNLVIIPMQDVFGWSDRINTPGTVTPDNWTFRLPWLSDRLDDQPEAQERQRALLAWAQKHGRS